MKLVLGGPKDEALVSLARSGCSACTRVEAAVAYADDRHHQLFAACKEQRRPLTYFGRIDGVHPKVLRELLTWGSMADARLVRTGLHAKVIWWHGFGAYVGSANLTRRAWLSNIESGVFISDDELSRDGGEQLRSMFDQLMRISLRVDIAVVEKLEAHREAHRDEEETNRRLRREASLADIFPEPGPEPEPEPEPEPKLKPEPGESEPKAEPKPRAEVERDRKADEPKPKAERKPEALQLDAPQPPQIGVEVRFFARRTSSGREQVWLTVSNSDGDDLSEFLGGPRSSGGALVAWEGGKLKAGTFGLYPPNQWKLTVSSRKRDARPLYDFGRANTKIPFAAVVRRDAGVTTLTLMIKVPGSSSA